VVGWGWVFTRNLGGKGNQSPPCGSASGEGIIAQPNGWALPSPRVCCCHRILEWPGLKSTTVVTEFQPPCYVQGCQPPDQAAQSHIQPGLECLQGWGIYTTSFGNLFQCVTTFWMKNVLLISNLNLPCLNLKPFPLVLSLSTPVNSITVSSCSPWNFSIPVIGTALTADLTPLPPQTPGGWGFFNSYITDNLLRQFHKISKL